MRHWPKLSACGFNTLDNIPRLNATIARKRFLCSILGSTDTADTLLLTVWLKLGPLQVCRLELGARHARIQLPSHSYRILPHIHPIRNNLVWETIMYAHALDMECTLYMGDVSRQDINLEVDGYHVQVSSDSNLLSEVEVPFPLRHLSNLNTLEL